MRLLISRLMSVRFLYCLLATIFALFPRTFVLAELKPTAIAPQHVVSLNSEAGWDLNAELNHPDGLYTIGEKLELRFSSPAKDVYVHLFNIDPNGKVCLIWPNDYHPENRVKKSETVQFPTPGSNVTFRVQAPVGKELLVLLATETPLNLRDPLESRKLSTFLSNVKGREVAPLTNLRSFVVEHEKPCGWAGKSIEVTTRSNTEASAVNAPVYYSASGYFSVQGVGEFKQTESKTGVVTHICQKGSSVYSVSHFNVPEASLEQATLMMNRARENQKKDFGGTVQCEQSLIVTGGIGFELQIRSHMADRDCITLSRTLRFGNRVYVITVSELENTYCKSTADAFMLSFKVTGTDLQVTGM